MGLSEMGGQTIQLLSCMSSYSDSMHASLDVSHVGQQWPVEGDVEVANANQRRKGSFKRVPIPDADYPLAHPRPWYIFHRG